MRYFLLSRVRELCDGFAQLSVHLVQILRQGPQEVHVLEDPLVVLRHFLGKGSLVQQGLRYFNVILSHVYQSRTIRNL